MSGSGCVDGRGHFKLSFVYSHVGIGVQAVVCFRAIKLVFIYHLYAVDLVGLVLCHNLP